MRNAKRRNDGGSRLLPAAGAEEVLGPVDFAVGGAKSRAAARILAEQFERGACRGPERVQPCGDVGDAWRDPDQAWALSVENIADHKVRRTVFAPAWMGVEDVRRFLYGDE